MLTGKRATQESAGIGAWWRQGGTGLGQASGQAPLSHPLKGGGGTRLEAYALAALARTEHDHAARASVKYELAILRRAFSIAVRQGRIPSRPAFPTIRVDNARSGFFEAGELDAVVRELPEPLPNVARFAYHTGWRSGEIRSLRWADVDWTAKAVRLEGAHSKNEEPRVFPFGAVPALAQVMEHQRA